MIDGRALDWYQAWKGIHSVYANDPDGVIDARFATRAVSFNNKIFIKTNDLGGLSHELVGYTSYKLKLFDRNYVIPGMKEKIGDKLIERIKAGKNLTVISYPFNILNEAHDQGPCVINIVIILTKTGRDWKVNYRVQMRIGEITKRLLVDFIKFQEIIQYWNDRMAEFNVGHTGTEFFSSALYGQSMFIIITEHLPNMGLKYDQDHWFHKTVRGQYAKFENPSFKMKMGKRVKKHVDQLKEQNK